MCPYVLTLQNSKYLVIAIILVRAKVLSNSAIFLCSAQNSWEIFIPLGLNYWLNDAGAAGNEGET